MLTKKWMLSVIFLMIFLTTSCASKIEYVYVNDICEKNLKVVKIKDPEIQPRVVRENLAYNNRVISGSKCGEEVKKD